MKKITATLTIQLIFIILGIIMIYTNDLWYVLVGIFFFIFGFTGDAILNSFKKSTSSERINVNDSKINNEIPKHYYHQSLMWFIAGFEYFGLLIVFIGIQDILLNSFYSSIPTILHSPIFDVIFLSSLLFAIFASIPLGFVFFQLYYVAYWKALFPIRFSKFDRVYSALKLIEHENPTIDFSNYLVGIKEIQETNVKIRRLPLSKKIGLPAYFLPPHANKLLHKAQINWSLFNNIYYTVLDKNDYEKHNLISSRKEENYALMGATRISILLAWFSFLIFDLIRVLNQPLPPLVSWYFFGVSCITFLSIILFSITREALGENSISFKYSKINLAFDEIRESSSHQNRTK